MFRTVVRRAASRASRQQQRSLVRSAAARQAVASTSVLASNLGNVPSAASKGGSVSAFHTSAPTYQTAGGVNVENPPFKKLMAANRGEIATRIVRAASELGIQTAGIYAHEGKQKQKAQFN